MYLVYRDRFFTRTNLQFNDLLRQAKALLVSKSNSDHREMIDAMLDKAGILFANEPKRRVLEPGDKGYEG